MKARKLLTAVSGAMLLGASGVSSAATWQAGDWTLGLGGNINTFFTNTFCDAGDIDNGGTYAGLACAASGGDDVSNVSNGLLPASLNFSASTNQDGWDIGANINVYYNLTSEGVDTGLPGDALDFSTVDPRQVYMTFGKDDFGTFKLGRDFGLFAFDAIINDMSLIGVGATFVAENPGHTTLGGLGFGYPYTDRLAQMNYTTPNMNGLTGTLGIMQGLDANQAGTEALNDGVGYHGKLAWSGDMGGTSVSLSGTFINYDVDVTTATGTGTESVQGFDLFGKVGFGNFSALAYYFNGEGMTSLALGGLVLPGFDAVGTPEEVDGYMLQGTYTMGKTRFGINWSENEFDQISVHENQKLTLGIYYNLTASLQLLAEYSMMESEIPAGSAMSLSGLAESDETEALAIGAILFF